MQSPKDFDLSRRNLLIDVGTAVVTLAERTLEATRFAS